jgi:hypothetical protein
MQLNLLRAIVLAAAALALLLAVAAGARQQAPLSKEATAPSPPVKTKAAQAAPAPAMTHDHSAMGKAPAKGPSAEGKPMTIVGEVMDPACFLEAGVKSIGPGHYQCAYDCARSGQTLAIYDRAADRIYFIAGELPGQNPNAPVFAYIHKKVDVTGMVYHRSEAWGIVINKVVLHEEKAASGEKANAGPASGKAAATTGAPAGK